MFDPKVAITLIAYALFVQDNLIGCYVLNVTLISFVFSPSGQYGVVLAEFNNCILFQYLDHQLRI